MFEVLVSPFKRSGYVDRGLKLQTPTHRVMVKPAKDREGFMKKVIWLTVFLMGCPLFSEFPPFQPLAVDDVGRDVTQADTGTDTVVSPSDVSPDSRADSGMDVDLGPLPTGLLSLTLSNGTLEPAFDPEVQNYTVRLSSIELEANFELALGADTTADINGEAVTTDYSVLLDEGASVQLRLDVTVDGQVPKPFQIQVFRPVLYSGPSVYLKASNAEPGDGFGLTVRGNGSRLVVMAFGEASNASGVNGDQLNNSNPFRGALYVFNLTENGWNQEAYIKGDNGFVDDGYRAFDIDGDRMVWGDAKTMDSTIFMFMNFPTLSGNGRQDSSHRMLNV